MARQIYVCLNKSIFVTTNEELSRQTARLSRQTLNICHNKLHVCHYKMLCCCGQLPPAINKYCFGPFSFILDPQSVAQYFNVQSVVRVMIMLETNFPNFSEVLFIVHNTCQFMLDGVWEQMTMKKPGWYNLERRRCW